MASVIHEPVQKSFTRSYLQRFTLSFEYPVVFTEGLFSAANDVFVETLDRVRPCPRHRLYVVVDDGVATLWPSLADEISSYVARYPGRLYLAAPVEEHPGGEKSKNDSAAPGRIQARIAALGLDRHSFVVVVGGGAFQDMVGYAAATAHRGLRVVRVPTTVLSQCDSGVGVKNGVNAFGSKNFLGTFAPPFAVLNDFDFLDTLEQRDRVSGTAEAIKIALIRDAQFFNWISQHTADIRDFVLAPVKRMIERCAELHLRHIATSGDPFEFGSARPLDFGHWAGHKLEKLSGHRLRHGEGVAIGMALDCRYAVELGILDAPVADRVCELLESIGLPTWDEALDETSSGGRPRVFDGLDEFRQHLGGELSVTLLRDIGDAVDVNAMDEKLLRRALSWLRWRARGR